MSNPPGPEVPEPPAYQPPPATAPPAYEATAAPAYGAPAAPAYGAPPAPAYGAPPPPVGGPARSAGRRPDPGQDARHRRAHRRVLRPTSSASSWASSPWCRAGRRATRTCRRCAAIIVGGVLMLITAIIIIAVSVTAFNEVARLCAEYGTGTHEINGVSITLNCG